jgi:Bacterial alpha-L-rhamnosidase 6 hairpin glycosidase domain
MKPLKTLITLAMIQGAASAAPIYTDSLVGSGASLVGTTVDTSSAFAGGTVGAVWSGSGVAQAGTGANVSSSNAAFLPITIEDGKIYTLTATMTCPSGPNWAALGFASTNSAGTWHTTADKNPWVLLRTSGQGAPSFYAGTGTNNKATWGSSASGTQTTSVILDTTGANWTTYASINGVTSTPLVYATKPIIHFVGFGNNGFGATATIKSFSVTATPASDIVAFNFGALGAATINGTTITLDVPAGTSLTALAPTFSHTGISVSPASGSTQNFTNPVHYIVTGPGGVTQDYTVTVSPPRAFNIAALSDSMIWSPSSPAGTQAYVAFRKNFTLSAAPTSPAMLHLFADTRYMLWVNGTHVLRGPCRFHPKHPEYDSIDIRPYLQNGSNTIVVLVHHYGNVINGRIISHSPGLTLLLEQGGNEILRTNSTWHVSDSTEYRPSPEAWNSIPDVIDGRMSPGAWIAPGFDDTSWPLAIPISSSTWGTLQPRAIPLPVETVLPSAKIMPNGTLFSTTLPVQLGGGSPQSLVLDIGRMAMSYASLEIEADEGSVLELQYALRYVNGTPTETYGVGTTYTARAGIQKFIAADQWCARYVTINCPVGRVRILGFKLTDRRYPFERVGSFTCSDPMLTRLWEMAVNTIETVSDDAYGSDARERNEWLQDPAEPNFITTKVALAGPGTAGSKKYSDPRLLKNILCHAALSQRSNGQIPAAFPTDRGSADPHDVIEDYDCQWVEALKIYYEATGDLAFVNEMWPTLVPQMQWFLDRRTSRGLLLAREYTSFDNPLAYITCEGATMNAFLYQAFKDAEYLV